VETCKRASGPVIDAPNYFSGRTERYRVAIPAWRKRRASLRLISLVRGFREGKAAVSRTF
jgi:hypothetical protein